MTDFLIAGIVVTWVYLVWAFISIEVEHGSGHRHLVKRVPGRLLDLVRGWVSKVSERCKGFGPIRDERERRDVVARAKRMKYEQELYEKYHPRVSAWRKLLNGKDS